jgi:hypothetical protein
VWRRAHEAAGGGPPRSTGQGALPPVAAVADAVKVMGDAPAAPPDTLRRFTPGVLPKVHRALLTPPFAVVDTTGSTVPPPTCT